MKAESSCGSGDSVAHKAENICYLALDRESLSTSAFNQQRFFENIVSSFQMTVTTYLSVLFVFRREFKKRCLTLLGSQWINSPTTVFTARNRVSRVCNCLVSRAHTHLRHLVVFLVDFIWERVLSLPTLGFTSSGLSGPVMLLGLLQGLLLRRSCR